MRRTLLFLATVDLLVHTAAGQLPPQVLVYTICLKPKPAGAFGFNRNTQAGWRFPGSLWANNEK